MACIRTDSVLLNYASAMHSLHIRCSCAAPGRNVVLYSRSRGLLPLHHNFSVHRESLVLVTSGLVSVHEL